MAQHWFIAHLIDKFTNGKSLGLDIGVGLDNWKKFKNCKTIGVDKNAKCNPDFVVDLEKFLPFQDNMFDVVITINALNYVENARQLLIEINRVMKKDGLILCVVDNEKSTEHPYVWQQMYLNRILEVTGFNSILSKHLKDYLFAKWYNRTSVYAFAVAQKIEPKKETFIELCFKCGKPLGKDLQIDVSTQKPSHVNCPPKEPEKIPHSYDIKTTHPNY